MKNLSVAYEIKFKAVQSKQLIKTVQAHMNLNMFIHT